MATVISILPRRRLKDSWNCVFNVVYVYIKYHWGYDSSLRYFSRDYRALMPKEHRVTSPAVFCLLGSFGSTAKSFILTFILASLVRSMPRSNKSKALQKSTNTTWTPFSPSRQLSVESYCSVLCCTGEC